MALLLVVEDDPQIQTLLQTFLEAAGHSVHLAGDGVEAVFRFHSGPYDLVLLDLMLPKIDGYGVCELIRKESAVPILMVTALDGEADQLRGYDLAIDEYITKPLSMPILVRKVEAVLRRAGQPIREQGERLTYGEIALDLEAREARVQGQTVDLTVKEFELLQLLLANQGRVLTRQRILDTIWQMDFFGDERVVDTHIKNLRRKLGVDLIETMRGVGYRVAKTHP